jgi:hypothetical protein
MAEKLFARVDTGAVHELLRTSADVSKLFHPSLKWVDVTGQTVKVGWIQTESGFAPEPAPPPAPVPAPPVPTFAELHAELLALAARIEALKPAPVAKGPAPASAH